MSYHYPAIFVQIKGREGYGIVFPDLASGILYGEDKEDAISAAESAIFDLFTDDEYFINAPLPSLMEDIKNKADSIIKGIFLVKEGEYSYSIEDISIPSEDIIAYRKWLREEHIDTD